MKKVGYWEYLLNMCRADMCDECNNQHPSKVLIVGSKLYQVCSDCYTVVNMRPRSFNRAGRRAFLKRYTRKGTLKKKYAV